MTSTRKPDRPLRPGSIFCLLLLAACDVVDESELGQATALQPADVVGQALYEAHCGQCHEGQVEKAPHREMIALTTPESILASMDGIMQPQSAGLSDPERIQVAAYLSGRQPGDGEQNPDVATCDAPPAFDPGIAGTGPNWGMASTNTRNIGASAAGIDSGNVHHLKPLWAVSFPGANRVRSQPTFAGGLVMIGSHGGRVYALDPATGCAVWSFQAAGEVRTGMVTGTERLYFGDVLGNVYAISTAGGELVWRLRADDHPNATITGTPTLHRGRLYIPVSSLEVSLAIDPLYQCCTFRGSVLAVDSSKGDVIWKTYTIGEEPRIQGSNAIGTPIIGPSGAVIWNSPAIDVDNNQLLVGTGENMSTPATGTSDAIIAMDLDDGSVNWIYQATQNDVWNTACDTDTPQNCPEENGPDFDFGAAAVIVETEKSGTLVVAGQKSGFVHALRAEDGKPLWKTRVGRGGIQGGIHFGLAASGERVLVPISDMDDGRRYDTPERPGMHAIDANTGTILWSRLHENTCTDHILCHPGISQAPTVIGDLVFAGAMDGKARAYDLESGKILWELDTTESFRTAGLPARGGSMGGGAGPVAFDGILLLSSGYGLYNHMPGNLLLALAVQLPAEKPAGG